MVAQSPKQLRHPIGHVVQRTGLSVHLLRAWERRYGVVQPARSADGERLYTDADVDRLMLMRAAVESGRRIGTVASLSTDELRALVRPLPSVSVAPTAASEYAKASLEAVRRLDDVAAHATLMRAVVSLSAPEFAESVAVPLLRELGDGWSAGELRAAHEHVGSVALRRVLGWLTDALPAPRGAPRIVLGTPAGERHEFGAMLAGIVASDEGWRVTYLGPDLPADDIAAAARVVRAEGVALSVIGRMPQRLLRPELMRLRRALPSKVPLVVGGAALERLAEFRALGVEVVRDFSEFRRWLRALHPAGGAAGIGA